MRGMDEAAIDLEADRETPFREGARTDYTGRSTETPNSPMSLHERHRFLVVAGLFEASLAVVAVVAGFLLGVDPFRWLIWDGNAAATGVAAALPIFLLFAFAFHDPFLGMRRIRELLMRLLGEPLAACRWYDLLMLAAITGFAEELLFRGVLQPWLQDWMGYTAAMWLSNIVFGIAHAITVGYAIAAGLIGAYLGWLLDATGSRNLLVPVVTHAVYDFLAFVVVARTFREARRREAEEAEDSNENERVADSETRTVVTREVVESRSESQIESD